MARLLMMFYGALCYLVFLFTFLYAIGFVGNLLVPKSIDSGDPGALGTSLLINVLLLAVFALQHTVMARPAFKRWWTRLVPQAVERSTYVLFSSLALILLYWQWRPMPAVVWNAGEGALGAVLQAGFWVGWATVLASTFMISHFDLFGLRQVYLNLKGKEYASIGFRTPLLYRFVRHPIMLGFVIAFWATPQMSTGHLLFASVTTVYILVALVFEERDLVEYHGDEYREYRRKTSMILPLPRRK